MELILIRHGQSRTNVEGSHQTFEDPLTEEGKARLFKIHGKFDNIFSSDMPRALETAKIMFPTDKIIIDERLREKRNGIFEGVLKKDADWSEVNKQPFMKRKAEGGESLEEVISRIKEFLSTLPEGRHVIVTHGTTLRIMFALTLGLDVEKILRSLQIGNGSVLTVTYDGLSQL
jgi:2,3-bisphosphoglycerate-dependent phosphoglycerate mutase